MKMSTLCASILATCLACSCASEVQSTEVAAPIDHALARQYFREAADIAAKDGGALWGKSLRVPLFFVDPATRYMVANQADAAGLLKREGDVFVGTLPQDNSVANSWTEFGGTQFTMVMWPLPEDSRMRDRLVIHECWHNIQPSLGFPAIIPPNAHLDARNGRIWLQMEWNALRQALTSDGDSRNQALRDALTFRAYRRSLFDSAAAQERRLEMHEGLAEYTGLKLCGLTQDSARIWLARSLDVQKRTPSFVSSFAYWSGPAYGLLLDDAGVDWRTGLTPQQDFGDLARAAYRIEMPTVIAAAAQERAGLYDGPAVQTAETEREAAHDRQLNSYRAALVDGPVLVLPLSQPNLQYDPRGLTPLENLGTVYPTFRIADVWGIVEGSAGGLIPGNWRTLTVSAPKDPLARPVVGEGWTLKLNEGWSLAPGTRTGDYTVVKR